MAEKLQFQIKFDDKQAQKVIDALTASTTDLQHNVESVSADKPISSIGSLNKVLGVAAAAASAVVTAIAGAKAVSAVVKAASVQEEAVNSLSSAMKVAGDFTEESFASMQAFASQLQQVTTVGDETTLQMLALTKAYGANNEQAKELVSAAVQLSAATGQDLESAVRQVSKTLGGFAGELGEVNPAIKALTKEQLQAGEAAKILLQQYDGSAQAQVETFSGSLKQVQNAYGDLLEAIGENITESESLRVILTFVKETLEEMTGVVKGTDEEVAGLGGTIRSTSKDITPLITSVANLSLYTASFIDIVAGLIDKLLYVPELLTSAFDAPKQLLGSVGGLILLIQEQIAEYVIQDKELVESVKKSREELDKWANTSNDVTQGIADVRAGIGKFRVSLTDFGDTIAEKFGELEMRLLAVAEGADKAESKTNKLGKTIKDLPRSVTVDFIINDPLFKIENGQIAIDVKPAGPSKEEFEEIGRVQAENHKAEQAAAEAEKVANEALAAAKLAQLDREQQQIEQVNSALDVAASLTGFITQGADGATGAVKLLLSQVEVFGFSIGKVLAPLVDLAMKSEEEIQKTVDEFVVGFEKVVDAVAEKADVIVIAIIRAIPKIFDALQKGAQTALFDAARNAADELYIAFTDVFDEVGDFILRKLGLKDDKGEEGDGNAITRFVKGLGTGPGLGFVGTGGTSQVEQAALDLTDDVAEFVRQLGSGNESVALGGLLSQFEEFGIADQFKDVIGEVLDDASRQGLTKDEIFNRLVKEIVPTLVAFSPENQKSLDGVDRLLDFLNPDTQDSPLSEDRLKDLFGTPNLDIPVVRPTAPVFQPSVPAPPPEPPVSPRPVITPSEPQFGGAEVTQLLRDIKVGVELLFKKDTNVSVEVDGRQLAETINDLRKQGLAF